MSNLDGIKGRAAAMARGVAGRAQGALTSTTARRVAPTLLVVGIHAFFACANAFAGTGAPDSIGGAAFRLFATMYEDWRGPICLVAVVVSGILLMCVGRNAHHWIFKIGGGVIIATLAPELVQTLEWIGGKK